MPLTWTLPGTPLEETFRAAGARSSPRYWANSTRPQEDLRSAAMVWRLVDGHAATGERLALVATSQGVWLDQIGKDRDIPRRLDEDDDAYKARLGSVEDKATLSACLAAANAVLAGAGIVPPDPTTQALYPLTYPTMESSAANAVPLYPQAAFCGFSYYGMERPFGNGPLLEIILPPVTPEPVARAVYEAVSHVQEACDALQVWPSATGGAP